jgi:hypothetical protein
VGLTLLLLSLLVRDSEFDYILIKRAVIKEQFFLVHYLRWRYGGSNRTMGVTQDIVRCLTGISRYYDQWGAPLQFSCAL